MYTFFFLSFSRTLPLDIEYSSLCYTVNLVVYPVSVYQSSSKQLREYFKAKPQVPYYFHKYHRNCLKLWISWPMPCLWTLVVSHCFLKKFRFLPIRSGWLLACLPSRCILSPLSPCSSHIVLFPTTVQACSCPQDLCTCCSFCLVYYSQISTWLL